MARAAPNTSPYALTHATLRYVVTPADKGHRGPRDDRSSALGLNTHDGD